MQALRQRRDVLFRLIRHQFRLIYLADGHAICDQYKEAKRAVDRKIKARERELTQQIQRECDAIAAVQDAQAQFGGDVELLSPIVPRSGAADYSFVERSQIARAFFDAPSTCNAEGHTDLRISIIDDMVSLCTRQERIFHTARRTLRIRANKGRSDDVDTGPPWDMVKSESESDPSVSHFFSRRCERYQCLNCLGNAGLPLHKRLRNLGSKHSLQRHFDRHHTLQRGESCPFPHPECASLTLDSMMHFKNYAATFHDIYMSDKS